MIPPPKLILHSNSYKSYIDILPTHTLHDARQTILRDLDPDQLPPSGNFAFSINGIRISQSQERRNLAVNIAENGEKVELIPIAPAGGGGVNNVAPQSRSSVTSGASANISSTNAVAKKKHPEAEGFACIDSSKSTPARNLFRPINGEGKQTNGQHVLNGGINKPTAKRLSSKSSGLGKSILPQKRSAGHEANAAKMKKNPALETSIRNSEAPKNVLPNQNAKHTMKIKQEYDSDAELYVENPGGISAEEADGLIEDAALHFENLSDNSNEGARANDEVSAGNNRNRELNDKDPSDKSARRGKTAETVAEKNQGRTVKQASKSLKKQSGAKASTVGTLELKRTVEVMDLCSSDEEDLIPAAIVKDKQDFTKMNGAERKIYWSDKKKLGYFFKKSLSNPTGAECEVCAETGVGKSCKLCGQFFHGVCVDASCHNICLDCKLPNRQCHLCNKKGGILVRTKAKPGSMKKWNKNKELFEESLFGKNNFCHLICGM